MKVMIYIWVHNLSTHAKATCGPARADTGAAIFENVSRCVSTHEVEPSW